MDSSPLREEVLRSLVRFYAYEILQRREPNLSELFPHFFTVWKPHSPTEPPQEGRHRVHILCDLLYRHFTTKGEESRPPTAKEIDRLWGEVSTPANGDKFLAERLDSDLYDLWGFVSPSDPHLEEAILMEFPGQSERGRRMRRSILHASRSGLPALIAGPEGSEKERIACFVHSNGERCNRPLFALNAELFNQERNFDHQLSGFPPSSLSDNVKKTEKRSFLRRQESSQLQSNQ